MASGGSGPDRGTGGTGGAPADAEYILVSLAPELPNARQLAAGGGISIVDGGPGGPITISASGSDASAWHQGGDSFTALGVLGTNDDFDLEIIRGGTPFMKIENSGTMSYTGPRLLVGDNFTPLYANGDIATFKKSLGDQLLLTLWNPYGQNPGETNPASATIASANDLGGATPHTATLEMFNSTWPAGNGGVNADEAAVISFGGIALRLLTQNDAPIIAASNFKEIGRFYEDSVGQEHRFLVSGAASRFSVIQTKSVGTAGTGYGGRFVGTNASGKNFYLSMPDSGVSPSWNDLPDYFTLSTDTGIGMRATVNQSAASGWQITDAAEFIQCAPPTPVSGATMFDGSISFSIDETLNKLNCRVKKSDGTVLNLTTPLALS